MCRLLDARQPFDLTRAYWFLQPSYLAYVTLLFSSFLLSGIWIMPWMCLEIWQYFISLPPECK